eukprot:CAMPEP_0175712802 /NCGR_PEP_ID=MMETSP0097-20121207/41283_1 /TAXON_ID=311494 /ORGANISM="Alexandrium monilatum, Strain CCMP3105" /LENGTH=108 /DNA_ID=CAMNT_0017020259 /DNA_START=22 /DNA_END=344 /DNA_ORIENTATION=+
MGPRAVANLSSPVRVHAQVRRLDKRGMRAALPDASHGFFAADVPSRHASAPAGGTVGGMRLALPGAPPHGVTAATAVRGGSFLASHLAVGDPATQSVAIVSRTRGLSG